MNAKPHTHEPKLERNYSKHRWELVYGDTRVRVWGGWDNGPSEKRVKKALAKAVRIHDQGSLEAGRKAARIAAAREAITLPLTDKAWGQDLLEGTVQLEPEVPQESVAERNQRLRKEQYDRQWKQEQEEERRKQQMIDDVRAEHWKQGRPDKKVKVTSWGQVLTDDQEFSRPFIEVVEMSDDTGTWHVVGG